ncbi:MAG: (deoxy)nucleoside triphosphate pyrophosphohydrolase [Clostridia bacterium]|nr:(deoxy)nucleoside triphosphate pyrophosphohydrolase [Clostridia bacterium]
MVQVAAALIWRGDRFMICQRPVTKTRALQWEFVGGKAEKGETLPQTLIRECREEIGVEVLVDDVFMEVDHVYPDITIHLTLFNARLKDGDEPKMLEHNDIRFILPSEIPQYDFCPADKEILKKIAEEKN